MSAAWENFSRGDCRRALSHFGALEVRGTNADGFVWSAVKAGQYDQGNSADFEAAKREAEAAWARFGGGQ